MGQREVLDYFTSSLNNGREVDHCIFKGKCGTGKTTTAQAVANDFNVDLLDFNASDDRSLNFIRKTIVPAMRSGGLFGHDFKIIFLDECENLDIYALRALRRPMEQYGQKSKIFFSCNSDKWLQSEEGEAILSRCMIFNFKSIDPVDIQRRLGFISAKENLEINDDAMRTICKKADGDMRKAITLLKTFKTSSSSVVNDFDKMFQKQLSLEDDLKAQGNINYG